MYLLTTGRGGFPPPWLFSGNWRWRWYDGRTLVDPSPRFVQRSSTKTYASVGHHQVGKFLENCFGTLLGLILMFDRLSVWLDNLPLQTVQRVIHILYPITANWGFNLDNEKDMDDSIFRHFLWTSQLPGPIHPEIAQHSVVLAIQTPWVLSPYDLHRFVECRSVSPLFVRNVDSNSRIFSSFLHFTWKTLVKWTR